jgi:polysaccharide biosynthesis/export protein
MLNKDCMALCKRVIQVTVGIVILGLLTTPRMAIAQVQLAANTGSSSVSDAPLLSAYTLGPGDRVRINIFQVEQYSGETQVLVDGSLNLPVVGSVSVQGMTLEQTAAVISAQYARILRRPIVTISLVTPRPLQIGVAGEVNHPGSYKLNPQGDQLPTLTEVLELAGGITQAANIQQIQVHRPQRSGADQVIAVDLRQLLQTGDLRYNLTLRDGDAVFIPTATEVNLAESSQLAAASFATDQTQPINIAVVGEVYRPGPYTVTGSARTGEAGVPGANTAGSLPTVTRAIQVAGGIRPEADIRQIQIRRPTRSGSEQIISINLWELLKSGDLRQDAILQEGDTVSVPTVTAINPVESAEVAAASFSPDTIRVNVVGEATRAGVVEVPPNTPLNQAILAAGGFNNRARRSSVDLVRLNLDGSVSQRSISVDLTQGTNEATNPALHNNDIVIVRRSGIASFSDTLGTALAPLSQVFDVPLLFLRLFSLF